MKKLLDSLAWLRAEMAKIFEHHKAVVAENADLRKRLYSTAHPDDGKHEATFEQLHSSAALALGTVDAHTADLATPATTAEPGSPALTEADFPGGMPLVAVPDLAAQPAAPDAVPVSAPPVAEPVAAPVNASGPAPATTPAV